MNRDKGQVHGEHSEVDVAMREMVLPDVTEYWSRVARREDGSQQMVG